MSNACEGCRWELLDRPLPASLRQRLVRGMMWSLAGAVIARTLALLAAIACARLLGTVQFGELGMIQSTIGTFGVFAGLGLGVTATRYVAEMRGRDPARAGRILALSSTVAVVSGTVCTGILILLSPQLATTMLATPSLAHPLAVGAGLVFFGVVNGAQTGALAGLEAFRSIAHVNLWAGLASFPLIAVGVWRWGLTGAVCGAVAGMGVNCLLNNFALRRECSRFHIVYDFGGCPREWRVLCRFSLPAFLASLVVGSALWIGNALLAHQPGGYAQLGIYAAADRWRLLILFVPASMFGLLVPVLSNLYGSRDWRGFRKVFRSNLLWLSALAFCSAVVVLALGKPIMSAYGPNFRAGWPVLAVLALSAVPEALNTLLGHPLIVANAMWWRCGFDALLAVVLVSSALFLVPRWGALGLASAYALAFSAVSAGLYSYGRRWMRALYLEETPAAVLAAGLAVTTNRL